MWYFVVNRGIVISCLILSEEGDIVVLFASLEFEEVRLRVVWPWQLTGLINQLQNTLKVSKANKPLAPAVFCQVWYFPLQLKAPALAL